MRHKRGAWYWWVTLLSAGLFSAIPMWHAYSRLRTPRQLRVALLLSALGVAAFALTTGSDTASGAAGVAYGVVLMTLIISSVVAVILVRPLAYPKDGSADPVLPVGSWTSVASVRPSAGWEMAPADGAVVSAALARRQLRERSRGIAGSDPMLARDLRIGRPDLHGSFDDGGLVDLNSAPVEVVAEVLELGPELAQEVIDARVRFNGFLNVDELLSCVVLTEGQAAVVKDRAVTLPL